MMGGMERRVEWSLLIGGRLPAPVDFLLESGRSIQLNKQSRFVLQLGTAFFDQDEHQKSREHPDGFIKLMFGGQLLARRSSVVYVGKTPFFIATQEQMLQCRGLILLLLIAISERFALEFSLPLKNFLVESLPEGIDLGGKLLLQPLETSTEPA